MNALTRIHTPNASGPGPDQDKGRARASTSAVTLRVALVDGRSGSACFGHRPRGQSPTWPQPDSAHT
jgi:hypothetical protein